MAKKKSITDELAVLRFGEAESNLKLMGVDIKKLREFEKDLAHKSDKLISQVRKSWGKGGENIRDAHDASLERVRKYHKSRNEQALLTESGINFRRLQFICQCHIPAAYRDHDHSPADNYTTPVTVSQRLKPGEVKADVAFSDSTTAKALIEAKSFHGDLVSAARIKFWFKYSFTPGYSGGYCICPVIQLNGYRLMRASPCKCLGSHLAIQKVKLNVRVEQVAEVIKRATYNIVNEDNFHDWGTDEYTGFSFDSAVDYDINLSMDLNGGDQTIVFVECECITKAGGIASSIIDMQSNPYFYFKVPELFWGPAYIKKPGDQPTYVIPA